MLDDGFNIDLANLTDSYVMQKLNKVFKLLKLERGKDNKLEFKKKEKLHDFKLKVMIQHFIDDIASALKQESDNNSGSEEESDSDDDKGNKKRKRSRSRDSGNRKRSSSNSYDSENSDSSYFSDDSYTKKKEENKEQKQVKILKEELKKVQ